MKYNKNNGVLVEKRLGSNWNGKLTVVVLNKMEQVIE